MCLCEKNIMKTSPYFYLQPNSLFYRAAIGREQKQFIKIAFAVHLSAVISAERYRSDSVALKSAVLTLVYFYIIMIVHKCQQSAKRKLLLNKNNLLLNSPTDRTFENRRGKYKELGKKVPQAYRVYVEDTFLPCDAVIASIFSKEETGLYYYGARYLDPKYSRWLSGDPALNDYIPKAPIDDDAKKHNENFPGMGGVFNTVNLHVYHYAGNNPVKYNDPDGRDMEEFPIISGSLAILLAVRGSIGFAKDSNNHIALYIKGELGLGAGTDIDLTELKNQGIDKLNEFIKPIEYVISSFTDKLLHSFFDKMLGE